MEFIPKAFGRLGYGFNTKRVKLKIVILFNFLYL